MTTQSNIENQVNKFNYPSPLRAWMLVLLLTVAYVFSFIDRWILGLLIEPIKADMGLTDFQIGLMLGPAFAIFYATLGVPLGWAADHVKRVWIVAAGIIVWSMATAASGLAKTFPHLFVARMSVGVGEATLSPCAMSMITDSFPAEKRGLPIAFYSAALSVGAAIANLLGAAILTWANHTSSLSLPIVGTVAPWQLTFFVLGIPGIFLGIVFLFLKEPKRQQNTNTNIEIRSNPIHVLGYIKQRLALFACFMSIFCYLTITAYSQGWLAPMFQRTWGWSPVDYALVNGLVLLAIGPISISLAGIISDKWYQNGRKEAPLIIAIIGTLIVLPSGVMAPLMPSGELAIAVYAINTVGITWMSATGITALVNIVPSNIRAQMVAYYYMTISLAGLFLGPTMVGYISDNYFEANSLRNAMSIVPLIFGLPVLMLIPITRKLYLREYNTVNAEANQ